MNIVKDAGMFEQIVRQRDTAICTPLWDGTVETRPAAMVWVAPDVMSAVGAKVPHPPLIAAQSLGMIAGMEWWVDPALRPGEVRFQG